MSELQKAQAAALEKALQANRENLAVVEQQALQGVPKQVVARLEETKNKLHEALNNSLPGRKRRYSCTLPSLY